MEAVVQEAGAHLVGDARLGVCIKLLERFIPVPLLDTCTFFVAVQSQGLATNTVRALEDGDVSVPKLLEAACHVDARWPGPQ